MTAAARAGLPNYIMTLPLRHRHGLTGDFVSHRVPIYAVSSLVSLYSLQAAFYVDAIRDLYESFVIYCFFSLLVEYLYVFHSQSSVFR